MRKMTEPQSRRPRRRTAASATTLPRPVAGAQQPARPIASGGRSPAHHRAHHVTKDYGYVKKDLLTILAVGSGVIGFIVAMSFWTSSNPW